MNIDQIITRVLAGKASAEELESLNAWKQESQENLTKLKEMSDLYNAADDLTGYESFDTDTAWTKVNQQIDTSSSSTARWLVIAAMLALVAGAFYFLQDVSKVEGPQIHYAGKGVLTVPMADGSIVQLDQGGQLEVPADWETNRTVKLSGRAYFQVEAQPAGSTFEVLVDKGVVTVVGTAFAVDASAATVEVGVQEGHVVYSLDSRKVDLFADDRVQLINGTIAKTSGLDQQYFSWVERKLTFKDALVAEALPKLAHHVHKEIVLSQGVDLSSCRISGEYSTTDIDVILKEWSLLLDLRYVQDGDRYVISSLKCK